MELRQDVGRDIVFVEAEHRPDWSLCCQQILLLILLVDCISELHALHNELLTAVSQLLILRLQRLADFKEIEALLFPNGRD